MRQTNLELLVLALVVAVHLVEAVLAPHERVAVPALLVVDPHVRAVIAVVIGDVRGIHLFLHHDNTAKAGVSEARQELTAYVSACIGSQEAHAAGGGEPCSL